MKRIVIDTDAGVDDSLAIVYASRTPDTRIEFFTTVSGNVPVKEVTQNVLLLRELLDLNVPVYSGADVPRARKLVTAPEVHGDDGLGGYRKSKGLSRKDWFSGDAALQIVRAAREHGKNLTIISLGPMTNIADAAAIDAEAVRNVGRIVQMGGVFNGYGNTTEFTEFNLFVDPEAAEFVLNSGVKVTFVPLDLTETVFLPGPVASNMLGSLSSPSPRLSRLLGKALRHYIGYHRKSEGLDGCYLHDPIAVAAALHPEWYVFTEAEVTVETAGNSTSGMTIADMRKRAHRGNSRIAVAFDGARFIQDFGSTVFSSKISRTTARSGCLRERFHYDFRNKLN